ncbi:MAG: hypothetical protein ACMXYG_03990 [Candidatus Woesearchaeota archaeon]
MHTYKIILWEIILIIASVFVFRSLWLLLDKYLIFPNEDLTLIISLIISIILTALAIYMLVYYEKKQKIN